MRLFIHTLALLALLIALFLTLSFYIGLQNQTLLPSSSAYLGFQLYGGISALLSLVFGVWGQHVHKKNDLTTSWISRLAIVIGGLALAILIAVSLFS